MSDQKHLMQKRREYEENISHQLQEYTDKAQEFGKSALMIAGAAFVTYQVVKLFTRSKRSKSKVKRKVYKGTYEGDDNDALGARTIVIKEDSGSLSMFDLVKAEMGGLLLALAKDKILAFINQLESSKTDAPEHKENN